MLASCDVAARSGGSLGGWRAAWVVVALAACGSDPAGSNDGGASKNKEPTGNDELATSTGDGGPVQAAGDVCAAALDVRPGAHEGSLYNAAADLAAALEADGVDAPGCPFDGPDVFLRHTVTANADVTVTAQGEGFVPLVAILDAGCTASFACGAGLPMSMLDVAAGTELSLAIGVAADAPALAAALGPDDLRFRVDVVERQVIGTGQGCGLLGQGRCETGSACMPDDLGGSRCTQVPGDTCASATELLLDDAPVVVSVDPAVPYSDAHQHPCAGARRRDRVIHVQWPAPGGTLVVSSTADDVALAVRGPGCAAAEALACATEGAAGTRVELGVDGPGGAFVFVELPADDPAGDGSELGPFDVEFALVP